MIEAKIKFVPMDSSKPIEGVVMDKVRMGDHDCYVVREVSEDFEKDANIFIVSPYAIRSVKTYNFDVNPCGAEYRNEESK